MKGEIVSCKQLEMKGEIVENPSTTINIRTSPSGGNSGGSDTRSSRPSRPDKPLSVLSETAPNGCSSSIPQSSSLNAPEKKLTLFALRLAIIGKTAYGLGKLSLLWASVVLLGGFASALKPKDFWFVTAILIVEGARIFSHSLELEWQYHSTRPRRLPHFMLQLDEQAHLSHLSQTQRTWLPEDVPLLPHWVFVSKNISSLIHWLQILDAAACVALSLMRIVQQDFGEAQNNQKSVLNVFYILALAEALMFLLEKVYWTWTIKHTKLFEQVAKECKLGSIGMLSLCLFFYDAHSKCIRGSIFDGLKMDLISFAEKLVDANSLDQIIGAKILQQLVKNERFAADTLHKIRSSTPVIRRLIEMLTWKYPEEKDLRLAASQIVSKLASKYAQLVAALSGALESITSLLHMGEGTTDGLLILKHLARDPDSCRMIQKEQGLLERVIDLTSFNEKMYNGPKVIYDEKIYNDQTSFNEKMDNDQTSFNETMDNDQTSFNETMDNDQTSFNETLDNDQTSFNEMMDDDQTSVNEKMDVAHCALEVVKNLVYATGETGRALRSDISESKDLMSNIQDLLERRRSHPKHQLLGLEILERLGMSEAAREIIGKTNGMLSSIIELFFWPVVTEDGAVRNKAGEALARLLLDSRENCQRTFRERADVVRDLVSALDNQAQRVNAANILRGILQIYWSDSNMRRRKIPEFDSEVSNRLHIVTKMPMILKTIMEEENKKLLEASAGLALQILKFGIPMIEIERAGINFENFASRLVDILKRSNNPESKVPKMQIFVIGLTIALMKSDQNWIQSFKNFEIDQVFKQIAETSKVEGVNVFTANIVFPHKLILTLEEESSYWLWMETCELILEAHDAGWINLESYISGRNQSRYSRRATENETRESLMQFILPLTQGTTENT